MSFVSTSTEFAMMDTRSNSGALVLPLTTDIPGRIINIKDTYGSFTNSSLTVYTQGGEFFEDGTNFKVLNNAFDQFQVYTASTSRWYITGGTEQNITTTNLAIVSSIQTFNWPSLCNASNTGYGSQFNPAAIGRIALLDNVFTSSTAALASTFIEMGNLNAQPVGMTPGGTFRWLMGVEKTPGSGTDLQLKIKRWQSFALTNSAASYGANISTLLDTVNIAGAGGVGINTSTPQYFLDVNGPVGIRHLTCNAPYYTSYGPLKIFPANQGGDCFIAFHSTISESIAYPWLIGRSATLGNAANFNICPVQNTVLNTAINTTFTPSGQVGINTPTPFSTLALDVNGMSRGKLFISTVGATSMTVRENNYGIYHNLTNTGFNSLTLTGLTGTSNFGWYVVLRNATTVAMSITMAGTACNNIPSPFALGSSNSATLAWDGALYRVF